MIEDINKKTIPVKKKIPTKQWFPIAIIVLLLGGYLLFSIIQENDLNFEEGECGNDLYLGHCFDTDNKYFGCNIENNNCNEVSFEIVMRIRLFEEMGVVIYGVSECSWCQKQLQEFGDYADYMKDKGLYVDCSIKKEINDCQDVKVTPTWKEDGKIVYEGYLPLEQIRIKEI